MAGLFPLLHLGRPWFFYWLAPYPNKMNLWPQWRSPLVWDFFAISTYIIVSLLFWYIGLMPDLATLRDRAADALQALRVRPVRARLARRSAALGAPSARLPAARRPGHAARRLGALGHLARLRDRQHARLPLDDLSAVLRRRRPLLRLRDGADAGDPAAPRLRPRRLHHDCAISRTPPRCCSRWPASSPTRTRWRSSPPSTAATATRSRSPCSAGPALTRRCTGRCSPATCWRRSCSGFGGCARTRSFSSCSASSSTSACGWSACSSSSPAWPPTTCRRPGDIFIPTFWDWVFLLGSISTFVWMFLVFVRVLPAISISEMRELVRESAEGKA